MRFAFRAHLHHTTFPEVRDLFKAADELPIFESGWVADHFWPTSGDPSGPCMESWTVLAALGQITQRLRLGVLVSSNSYRHPAVLANIAATLDVTTDGRLELGLGTGWNDAEADGYGMSLLPLKQRFDAFDEACQVVTMLLSQKVSNFAGDYYQLRDAYCEPKPVQQPHPPLCIGGAGEKRALRSVARFAQHWNYRGGDLTQLDHKREVLAGHCADFGRDPSEILESVNFPWDGEDESALRGKAEELADAGLDLAILTSKRPHRPEFLERAAVILEDVARG